MKKLMIIILAASLVLASIAIATESTTIVANGSTSVSLYVVIEDSSGDPNTSVTITDLDFFWIEQGQAVESDTSITALGGVGNAFANGQAIHCQSGLYRVDFNDDCFDGGIGTQVQLIVDDVVTSNRTAYLTVMLSPQVDANTVVGSTPMTQSNIETFSETGADAALVSVQLDHLVGVDTTVAAGGDLTTYVVDGSILSHLMANADTSTFDSSANSLAKLWLMPMSDLAQDAIAYNASVLDAINWIYMLARNKSTATATEIALYKDNGSTKQTESTISDDGTTYTRGEYRAVD